MIGNMVKQHNKSNVFLDCLTAVVIGVLLAITLFFNL